jgi:hypothetical protein
VTKLWAEIILSNIVTGNGASQTKACCTTTISPKTPHTQEKEACNEKYKNNVAFFKLKEIIHKINIATPK